MSEDLIYSYEDLQDLVLKYQRENIILKDRQNKAIEFIYENAYDKERKICVDDLWGEIPILLDILTGEENDRRV